MLLHGVCGVDQAPTPGGRVIVPQTGVNATLNLLNVTAKDFSAVEDQYLAAVAQVFKPVDLMPSLAGILISIACLFWHAMML